MSVKDIVNLTSDDPGSATLKEEKQPFRLKEMTVDQVSVILADDARIIVPVGSCARYHPSLPLGSSTIIAEALADSFSAEFKVLRAPAVEYGVNATKISGYPGRVSVRKKTLHQFLNDTLSSWEDHGVNEFILLTAHAFDPHLEAMETVGTVKARVRAVNILAVNMSEILPDAEDRYDYGTIFLSLMLYIAPQFVRNVGTGESGSAEMGRNLYQHIRSQISERIFLAPAPSE